MERGARAGAGEARVVGSAMSRGTAGTGWGGWNGMLSAAPGGYRGAARERVLERVERVLERMPGAAPGGLGRRGA